jgi:hypothetical protein
MIKSKQIAVYGLGHYAEGCISYLKDKYEILFIIDKIKFEHLDYKGIKIISPDEFSNLIEKPLVIICRKSNNNFDRVIIENLCENYLYFDHIYIVENFSKFSSVRGLLSDEYSQILFDNIIGKKFTGSNNFENKLISNDQYFGLSVFRNLSNYLMIDCGSHIGIIFEKFLRNSLGNIGGYIGVDCIDNHQKLFINRLNRLKNEYPIDINNIIYKIAYLDDENGKKISIINKGTNSRLSTSTKNSEFIESITLNQLIEDYPHLLLSYHDKIFIKMDIEGNEFPALNGGLKSIIKYRPLLAISIYHQLQDMIDIPSLLNANLKNYKYHIRQHDFNFNETILYCIPNEKIL